MAGLRVRQAVAIRAVYACDGGQRTDPEPFLYPEIIVERERGNAFSSDPGQYPDLQGNLRKLFQVHDY